MSTGKDYPHNNPERIQEIKITNDGLFMFVCIFYLGMLYQIVVILMQVIPTEVKVTKIVVINRREY
jgi:hypothetical protein